MSILAAYIVPHPPLIVPTVGRGQERKIQATIDACETVARAIRDLAPETVVVATPHGVMYRDYIHISPGASATGDLRRFGDAKTRVSVACDREFATEVARVAERNGVPAGTLGENDKTLDHATLVPLWFLQREYKEFQLVRISVSGLSGAEHFALGKCVAEAAETLGRRTVFIASGDLSHRLSDQGPYDYAAEGPIFDKQVTQAMAEGDFPAFLRFSGEFCEAAGECGLRSFQILAGALDGKAVDPSLLSYEGPFGVGYAVAAFPVTGGRVDEDPNDPYVQLARQSLEAYVKRRERFHRPDGLPADLTGERAGVFVSLKKHGQLRGCIGTIEPLEASVADEIIKNAVSAGVGDPRFDPVRPDELQELVYSVDVLGRPETIQSMEQLDVVRYGVIVSKGRRRGLLLPNLEGVDTPEEQVAIALRKAGIDPEESYAMERFEVVRHK